MLLLLHFVGVCSLGLGLTCLLWFGVFSGRLDVENSRLQGAVSRFEMQNLGDCTVQA